MGLDMYLNGRKYVGGHWQREEPIRKEDNHPISSVEVSLGYWRKHRKLHGFILIVTGKHISKPITNLLL